MPKALWVNTFRTIRDQEKVARYAALAGDVMAAHGGRFLARGLPAAAFEAGSLERTSVIEFPSVEQAIAAYESEGYQQALRALDGGATRDIRIVPMVD
ncbi:uncharacterized protein (DUF1330 family) [Diaminobutyricimonas aerilata]|uniref:Uncharacterized protein (DUF1330 family) n=1 Tax=Diaminobutyricimonas aerilata TaxID=1162967 RepID=A0A2M9CGG0_9MICO|nr:DUF1330 domain-containing protein [Diaminobutyricimonas aerilata]PJJ70950.1 uncharacterized protein (DUF1330 family) [Diaminobutyricimonas aerilata]